MSASATPTPDEQLNVRMRKCFPGGNGPSFTLDVSLVVSAGITILFGASGAGKTTLLDCIAGLQTPDEGEIAIGETVLFNSQSRRNLPASRRSAGYLLQSLALFPHMTVEQNVQYGLAALDKAERAARSLQTMESFRIASMAQRRPGKISGGERQRVALARALVRRPRTLLLDEPMSALDRTTRAKSLDDLRRWNEMHSVPILYVTHDREEVFALGDRVLVLEVGR